jgi:hypothetical protein
MTISIFRVSTYPNQLCLTPTQTRHPERSASQIYCTTKGSMARSRRTPAMLPGRCSRELSSRKLQRKKSHKLRPERTRTSCYAALDKTACAAFRKESRMKLANATNLDRKSGVAQWRDLLFLFLFSRGLSQRLSLISPVKPTVLIRTISRRVQHLQIRLRRGQRQTSASVRIFSNLQLAN